MVTSRESCSGLLPLTHPSDAVFSSLAAPVPKSQEGQGPGPVSRAGSRCRGCSASPPPRGHPGPGRTSWRRLLWTRQQLCSPFTAPSRPLPSASAFLAGIWKSLCLGGRPAAQELESPCSWLTQHPPWSSVPLPPGMNSSRASWGAGRKVGCCGLKHHVGWAGLCWAGLALPAGTPPLLTSEALGQVWTWHISMMRPWKRGGFLPVTQGHVWWAQGL